MTWSAYHALIVQLLSEGKTTGPIPDYPDIMEYCHLNEKRMSRIEKTFQLDAEAALLLAQITQPMQWWVLTEGWCGDAAQVTAVIDGLAKNQPNITLRFLLRDQNPALMDAFLTDGGRSIPKVIFTEPSTGKVLGSWGPRPAALQEKMLEWKAEIAATQDKTERIARFEAAKTAVHTWYAHDKTVSTQRELTLAAVNAVKEM